MENDAIHLEHQTAPESTRGLFDPPADKAPEGVNDKRRSFHAYGPLTEKPSQPTSQGQQRFNHGHQRSRSAVMLSNGSGRRSFGLQPLAEEGTDDDSKKKTELADVDATVTVDSLQDMINTLKALPPVNLKDTAMNRSSSGGGGGHRKHSSVSLTKGIGADTMQSMVQNTVQELRNIPNDKNARQRSRRAASMSSSMEASAAYRNAALAEAEAKLSGNLGSKVGGTIQEEEPRTQPMPRRHSTSRATSGFVLDENRRLPGRRRYSESSSTFDRGALGVTGKRMSLQQLPTLSENSVLPNANRRLTFNKPLTLEDSNKRMIHSRRSSRNLDFDWRSSSNQMLPPFSPTTASQQSFNLVPFTPTRVSFTKDDANPHQRRPLFIAHLPFSALPPLFRSRQLVRGTLRVNKRNRSDAYVSCDDLDDDVYVCGSRDRNRALEGDVVAVRLVDVEKVLREKKEKEEAKLARNGGKPKTRMPDEEDENEIIFGGDEDVDTVKPKYCGVVVAVLERAQNQVFSGSLTLMRPNNKRAQEEKEAEESRKADGEGVAVQKEAPRIVWFKATDKRVPLIAIPIEQAPPDFVTNSEKYANKLFVGSIKRWPITSLHPFGSLEREIGTVTDLNVQTLGILADNNVSTAEFSEAVKGCIPEASDEIIAEENRRDLTDLHAFTIDPAGSNVLDDALSIEKSGDDSYSIGVHISDVASFIQPHSPLDKEARDRGVRVDLHHKYIPMLPEELTKKLTNLEPNQKRRAISIVWQMNSKGDILDTWVGKSLVRSSTKLSYEDAQKIIDGEALEGEISIPDATVQGVKTLYSVAKILREARLQQGGAITLKRDRLAFEFENVESAPIAVSLWKEHESAIIVREFLLLANKVVAQRVSSHFPELALLRRQAPPVARKIRELKDYAERCLGVQVDISSAEALGRSIASVEDATLRKVLSVIVLKTFYPPKYFCTGTLDIQKYSHYSLNTPLFTHFTAPSRRYADIVVQRQLEAALTGKTDFYLERDTMQKLAHHCNVKKEAALTAREHSNLLFLAMHLCAKQQPPSNNVVLYRDAVVVAVSEQHFDVMIPEYNIEKRIHLAHLPAWKADYDQAQHTLTIHWKKNIATSTGNDRQQWNFIDDEDDEDEELDEELLIAEMQQDSSEEEGNSNNSAPYNVNGSNAVPEESSAKVSDLKVAESAPSVNPVATKSTTKRTSRRASVLRARLSDSTAYNTEQATQTIKALDRIKAVVIVEMVKPPPIVRVLAANPFA